MRCGACGTANEAARRFCAQCGARLPAACTGCGFINAPGARFCGGCGATLEPQPPADAPAAGERRPVTMLFADLAGYTSLASRADPEQVRDLLDGFFDTVDGITVSFGGSVNQHLGDAVLALFGAPVAHGNDSERAVGAAIAMHEAVARLTDPDGRPLSLHVGIASGVVVAAATGSREHRSYTVTGESVNLASRLSDLAEGGETLVSDAVRSALGQRLLVQPRGEVALKGLAAPVRVWRVDGLLGDGAGGAAFPFVGRQAEIRQFRSVLAASRESREGAIVRVRGEAGIGKTRLVRELVTIAEAEGFRCHAGAVLDFGVERGRDAIRQIARSLLDLPPLAAEAERTAAAAAALARHGVREDHTPFLFDLLDLPQPLVQRRLVDAMDEATRRGGRALVVAELAKAACRQSPTLIVVEDLHWADAQTLETLARLGAVTAETPIVLVLTSRLEGDPLDARWRARLQGAGLVTLDLGPLRRVESERLAAALATGAHGFLARCVERAAGNPLFLEQLLHHARDDTKAAVPASIQSVVLARLDQLPAGDRVALQTASVLGQRFSLAALRHLLGDPGYRCDALVARFLVQPEGDDFLFRHALIRDAVYESLLRGRRRELHGRAAEWFARNDLVLHAEHLDRAEAGEAARAYGAAAEAELEAYRPERALALVRRGLKLASTAGERSGLALLEGEILHDLGRAEASIEAFEQALATAVDEAAAARARIGLASGMRMIDRLDEALAQLDQAQPVVERLGLMAEQSRLHALRGNLHFPRGEMEACAREHGAALRIGEAAGSPELVARALGGLGDAAYAEGRFATALDCFTRCVALARDHGLGRIEVANRSMVAWCRFLIGLAGAAEQAEAAVQAAVRVGQGRAEMIAHHAAGFAYAFMLVPERARAHALRAGELEEQLGLRRFRSEHLGLLGLVEALAGRHQEAEALLDQAFADARTVAPAFMGPMMAGLCAMVTRDPARRAELLAEGERMLGATALAHNHHAYFMGAIEAALRSGDPAAARDHARRLEAAFAAEMVPRVAMLARRGRALAAWIEGRRDEATRRELEEVAAEAERQEAQLFRLAVDRALAGQPLPQP